MTSLAAKSGTAVEFFCQAGDGIRHLSVSGVQTCALPISLRPRAKSLASPSVWLGGEERCRAKLSMCRAIDRKSVVYGKSVDLGGRRIIKKKTTARSTDSRIVQLQLPAVWLRIPPHSDVGT